MRLAQCHETFRCPELQAVATLFGIEMEIIAYNEFVSIFQGSSEDTGERFLFLSTLSYHPRLPALNLTDRSPSDTILCGKIER